MTLPLEHNQGSCPRCGNPLDRADGEAVPHVGGREYVCPVCGWTFETGTPTAGSDEGLL